MKSVVPKYYRLKKDLIAKINEEAFSPNQQIPTEKELGERYTVSRITVRKAIDELVNEGYLYRIQGKGTYVKSEERNRDLFSITSCTEDIERMGMTPSRELVRQEVVAADRKRQNLLRLEEGADVLLIARVYFADEEPINYTISYINHHLFPGLERISFRDASLYDAIEHKHDTRIVCATRTLEAVTVDEEVAEKLHMKKGDPVLLFRATTFCRIDGEEIPFETLKCYYRSDKFKFYINQVR